MYEEFDKDMAKEKKRVGEHFKSTSGLQERNRDKLREFKQYPFTDEEDMDIPWKPYDDQEIAMLSEHIRGRPRPEEQRFFFTDSEMVESDSEDYFSEQTTDPLIAEQIRLDQIRKERVTKVAVVGSILALALLL